MGINFSSPASSREWFHEPFGRACAAQSRPEQTGRSLHPFPQFSFSLASIWRLMPPAEGRSLPEALFQAYWIRLQVTALPP